MNSYELDPVGRRVPLALNPSTAGCGVGVGPGQITPWMPGQPMVSGGVKALVPAAQVRKYTPVLGTQVGGDHYTSQKIQPIQYIWANKLGFSEGNAVKYLTRWKLKGGIKDLEKAAHHINLLIEEARRAEREDGAKYGI